MKKSLTETVIEQLKYQILSGEYEPGEKLPTLREMADIFDVSRSVINAVVVDLETNGYIKIVPTKWIEVANWKKEMNFSILSDQVAFGLLDVKQLTDLLEARKFLELECVRKACANSDKESRAKLQALIIEEEIETDPKKRSQYDLRFHYLICKMSGNMVYGILLQAFEDTSQPIIERFYSDMDVHDFVLEKHKVVAKAITENNEIEAEREMRLLLEHGEKTILKQLQRR